MTARTWHCERAWLGGATAARDVVVAERDGVIEQVTPGVPVPPGALRLSGVVLPGLANAHSHAFHRALRGRQREGLTTFWAWREQMYELAARLTPDTLRDLAAATYAEMACAGFTTVGEFHYLHHDREGRPYADPNATAHALVDAAKEAGVRLTLLDTCYLESAPGVAPVGVQARFADDSADAWSARVDALHVASPCVTLGAAIHSVRAVPRGAIEVVSGWAAGRGAPLHAHVSEQPAENEAALAAYGVTPTSLLAASGALTERFTAVHATHATAGDVAELARAGASVCACPTTERDLGDGLLALGELTAAQVSVAIGTDGHSVIDPFEELRALEGHERLRTQHRGTMDATALLASATTVAHRALGWPDAGRLAPGAPCDLVAVDTSSRRLAGTDGDVAGVVAAATAADVRTVVVAGEVVVDDGRHRSVDVARVLALAVEQAWA